MAVKVGSFTKSTDTGVPVSQAVTGVGFTPKALIMWTSGNTSANTWADGYRLAFGVTSGSSASGSIAGASEDNVSPVNTTSATVAKALSIVQWGESTLAECDLTSFDADGFTLSWTTNDNQAYVIGYMAIGGDEIANAKAVTWQTPASTGDLGITGVGFQPAAVLHLIGNQTSLGASAALALGIGAMDSSDQWAFATVEPDARAAADRARHFAESSRAIHQISSASITGTARNVATYVSMDADGFTVNFSTAAANYYVISLCLAGNVDVGHYDFASNSNQAVTGVGFVPGGVFQVSTSAQDNSSVQGNTSALSAGAMSASTHAAAFGQTEAGSNPNNSANYMSTEKAVLMNDAPENQSFKNTISCVSMDADGFTVAHTGSSISAPGWMVGYLAVKAAAASTITPHAMHYKRMRTQ